ncbi:MAG: 3-phosphoglycerate dehydrogenase [Thermotogae bacterium]|nr:3-phosphoglycerate dehydrogenase [Thermotogota bacterium]
MWLHINDPLDKEATAKLRELLPNVKITEEHYDNETLMSKIDTMDVLVVRSATNVTGDFIEKGKNLKIIGRAGMGLDNIDTKMAKEKNIQVINTPGANSLSVAELVVSMILSLSRSIVRGTKGISEGKWEKKQLKGIELSEKTVGIIGFGNIGKLLSKILHGFSCDILVYDVFEIPENTLKEYGVKQVSLEEIYRNSNIISLHVPKNDATYHMISEEQFEMMKEGTILINASRGGIVDEKALLKYLKNKKLYGAGLDVFEKEPPEGDFYSELLSLDNIVTTPHIGATTKEAQFRVGMDLVDRLVNAIKTV